MKTDDTPTIQQVLRKRREDHRKALQEELKRLTEAASRIGVRRIIQFGSSVRGNLGLTSDLDLLIVWDTPLDFLERTVDLYRRLLPRVAVDMLVYTPDEMVKMRHTPLVRKALEEGRVIYEA